MCSMHGLPTIGTIGFGWFEVKGRRRVPSPPAITTALTAPPSPSARSRGGNPVSPTSPLLAAAAAPQRRIPPGEPVGSPEPPPGNMTASRRHLAACGHDVLRGGQEREREADPEEPERPFRVVADHGQDPDREVED